jgi:hypothetical protein
LTNIYIYIYSTKEIESKIGITNPFLQAVNISQQHFILLSEKVIESDNLTREGKYKLDKLASHSIQIGFKISFMEKEGKYN